jgi:DNA-binding PadR family transcriptional regulator
MSGYDIILFVHSEYGVLLGAGMVYNLLHSLEKRKLIKAKYTKRAKCYVLDLAGEDVLEVIVDNHSILKEVTDSVF